MIKKDVLDDSDTFERKSNDGRAESEFEFKKANNSDLKGDISAFQKSRNESVGAQSTTSKMFKGGDSKNDPFDGMSSAAGSQIHRGGGKGIDDAES